MVVDIWEKVAIKLKMESYRGLLTGKSPEEAEGYRWAKHAAALAVAEAKPLMWEEFVEAFNRDSKSADDRLQRDSGKLSGGIKEERKSALY